ncbi:hypothetical protein BDV96DRAFT_636613 [Lophiotrema nucula]|uniref:Uncharacterized protein n=1 Tax=Lophiotrema nucula TaxID=690887 RepID=A0A6A5YNQ0_9PLEO|nr:hypothetical protein BDV96DRAFT_636613 [Lophiotrema nucula]
MSTSDPTSASSSLAEPAHHQPPVRRRVDLGSIASHEQDDRLPPDVLGVEIVLSERDVQSARAARSRSPSVWYADLARAFQHEGGDYALAQAIYLVNTSIYITTDTLENADRLKEAISYRMPESTGLHAPLSVDNLYALNEFAVSSWCTGNPGQEVRVERACNDMFHARAVRVKHFVGKGLYVVNFINDTALRELTLKDRQEIKYEGKIWKFKPWSRSMQHSMCLGCWRTDHHLRDCRRYSPEFKCGFCSNAHLIRQCSLSAEYNKLQSPAKRAYKLVKSHCWRCDQPGHGPKDIDICKHPDAQAECSRMAAAESAILARFTAHRHALAAPAPSSDPSPPSGSNPLPGFVRRSLLPAQETEVMHSFSQHISEPEDSSEEDQAGHEHDEHDEDDEDDEDGDDDTQVIPETPFASQTVPSSVSQPSNLGSAPSTSAEGEQSSGVTASHGDVALYHLEDLDMLQMRFASGSFASTSAGEEPSDREDSSDHEEVPGSDTEPDTSPDDTQRDDIDGTSGPAYPRPTHLDSMLGSQLPEDDIESVDSGSASPTSSATDPEATQERESFYLTKPAAPTARARKAGTASTKAKLKSSLSTVPSSKASTFISRMSKASTSRATPSNISSSHAAVTEVSPSTPDKSRTPTTLVAPPPSKTKRTYTSRSKQTQENEYARQYPQRQIPRQRSSVYGLRQPKLSRKRALADDDAEDSEPALNAANSSRTAAPTKRRRALVDDDDDEDDDDEDSKPAANVASSSRIATPTKRRRAPVDDEDSEPAVVSPSRRRTAAPTKRRKRPQNTAVNTGERRRSTFGDAGRRIVYHGLGLNWVGRTLGKTLGL